MSQEQNEAEKLVGQVLASTYQLERLLVSGGMGAVFRARHIRTGGVCAVKVLHSRSAANAEIYERFLDEARIISALRHPNIVQVTDLDQDASGLSFIVMELLEGEDLQDRIERTGKLELTEALQIVHQISSALYAAHQKGVIHRDLKPRNIFLARHEQNGKVTQSAKVIDFGVSKIPRAADKATRDLLVLGTPRYMAPEGALGKNSEIDGRSDQWSVAVILYRMLSGKLPFDQENIIDLFKQVVNDDPTPLEQLEPTVPPYVLAAIKRALQKKKDARFPSMLEFMEALTPPQKGRRAAGPGQAQLSLKRTATFGLFGALLAGLILLPLLKRESNMRKTGAQASEQVRQMEQELAEERWDDAEKTAEKVQSKSGLPPFVRESAEQTKKRAETGRQSSVASQKLIGSLLAKDYDEALQINRQMPPSLGFRVSAQQFYDVLLPMVIGIHLQKAEAARGTGNCTEVAKHVSAVLALQPNHPDALHARWRPCASFATATAPGPYKLAGYPPARDDKGTSLDLPGDYTGGKSSLADVDRLLREAQLAHESGQFARAVTLAHAAAGTPIRAPTAWRIFAVSACNLKDPKLINLAAEHLDVGSKEFVRNQCKALGVSVPF